VPLAAGTRLGPYEIVAPIGAGGMGEVYRARDTRLDRTVAVKVLPPQLAERPEARERFEREARAVASLNHPHICALHDIGKQDGIEYLVMEYLEGATLGKRLSEGPLPIAEVLTYAIQIAWALDAAHRQGVVHRDLKPSNVMLTKTGAKLLDFGLARIGVARPDAAMSALPTRDAPLTTAGSVLGTFQYMAPEQLHGQEADARADIFSFGAVLYEMATGRKAFEARSQASLIGAILHTEPPAISSVQADVPRPLDHLVTRCLAKNPEERWQAAHDLMLELKWIAEAPSSTPVVAPAPTPAPPAPAPRPVLPWAIAAALMVAVIALAVAYFLRPAPDDRAIQFSVLPPEKAAYPALSGPPVISSDGRRLAFVSTGPDGRQLIWIRPLDSRAAHPLAGSEGAVFPFWSPDSRFLGFFAAGKLKKIDVSGGPAQTIADAPNPRGGTWSRQGVIVFSPSVSRPLLRVSAAGGPAAPVTAPETDGATLNYWPSFLPDGRRFLYFRRTNQPDASGAYLGSLDSKDSSLLVRGNSGAVYSPAPGGGYLLFARERALMAQPFDAAGGRTTGESFAVADQVGFDLNNGAFLSVSDDGVLVYRSEAAGQKTQFAWFDRDGRQIRALTSPGDHARPALSPDETTVAFERDDHQAGAPDIWLLDLARGAASRFTFDPGLDQFPVWSHDGSRIVFSSNRSGRLELYHKPSSGAGTEQPLLQSPLPKWPVAWSRDGRYLAFVQLDPKTSYDIWVLPLTGDAKPYPVAQSPFGELRPDFSPDARWIAYVSDETGRYEVYVQSFAPGEKSLGRWQVSTGGGFQPRWRRDGKELFFSAPDRKLMAVDVQAGPGPFKAGVPRALFDAKLDTGLGIRTLYYPSADGKRFFINTPVEESTAAPMHVVVNWTATIRK